MGLEPAFAKSTAAWPLAGIGAWPVEPDDPEFTIPCGALHICDRDFGHKIHLTDANPLLSVTAGEPLSSAQTATRNRSRKWLAAVLASCALHAAVAMFFMTRGDDPALIEGSADAGITLLGNAAEDQSAAGDLSEIDPATVTNVTMVTMLEAKPVEPLATQVVPDLSPLEPVEIVAEEAPAAETIQPVTDQPAQPATTDSLPEILATDRIEPVDDDNAVQKPVEAAKVEPAESEVALAPAMENIVAEVGPVPAKPTPKPEPVKKSEQKPARKPVKKVEQPRKADKAPANAGSSGTGQTDTRKGEADGAADGTTTVKGRNGSSTSAGNAAVTNYPGKVAAKLRRALRGISRSARSKAERDVHVAFTVSASGGVAGLHIAQSSGSPELDGAALEVVRRAAPFPPIPPEAGRSSWQFTLPLGVGR